MQGCRQFEVKQFFRCTSARRIPPHASLSHLNKHPNRTYTQPINRPNPPTQPNPTQPNPTQPNPTQPNPTQPNPTQPNPPTHPPTHPTHPVTALACGTSGSAEPGVEASKSVSRIAASVGVRRAQTPGAMSHCQFLREPHTVHIEPFFQAKWTEMDRLHLETNSYPFAQHGSGQLAFQNAPFSFQGCCRAPRRGFQRRPRRRSVPKYCRRREQPHVCLPQLTWASWLDVLASLLISRNSSWPVAPQLQLP